MPVPIQVSNSPVLNGAANSDFGGSPLDMAADAIARGTVVDRASAPKDNIQCVGDVVPLDSIFLDPMNAMEHPDRNMDAIMDSLCLCGQRIPLVVRSQNRVIAAGNGRHEAMRQLGWTKCAISLQPMTDKEFYEFAIADNRSPQHSKWKWQTLAKVERLVNDLGGKTVGFSLQELREMRTKAHSQQAAPKCGEDDVFDVARVVSITGDVWTLGRHRLVCGDAAVAEQVQKLMRDDRAELVWTDPPYGVAVGDKNKYLNSVARSNRIEENLQNDVLDEEGLLSLLRATFGLAKLACVPGASWYVAGPSSPNQHTAFCTSTKEIGVWRQILIWVKNNATFAPLGQAYHWRHEPIIYGWLPDAPHRYYGGRQQDTVWEIDRPVASPLHPTMKPVELVARAIRNSSLVGDIVFDPFTGSGSTLIAAEKEGRRARLIEIDPKYCDVILERWSRYTGGDPIRERDGKRWSELNGRPVPPPVDVFSGIT